MAPKAGSARRGSKDAEGALREVIARLESIERRLEKLESYLAQHSAGGGDEAARALALALKLVKGGSAAVDLAWLAARLTRVQPAIAVTRDELSKSILEVVALKGPLNISELTQELRKYRGKASRRIVAERVNKMAREGMLSVTAKGREKVVDLPA
jgi:hypothetical protein